MATLHLICGLPGSGKTTLGKRLERELGAQRLSPDASLFDRGIDGFDTAARAVVEASQWEEAKAVLQQGQDVILENGFWERAERDRLRGQAAAIGAVVKVHYLEAPLAELKRRLTERNKVIPKGSFHVPPEMFDQWATMFEPPTDDELA